MGEILRLLRHIFLSRSFERDEAGATRQKSRQRPQKRRFAGAIGAGDLQRLAAREHETEISITRLSPRSTQSPSTRSLSAE